MYCALSTVEFFSSLVLDYNSGFFMVIRGRMTGLSIGRRMVSPPLGEGLEIDIVRRLRAKGHHKRAGKGRARGRGSALGGLNGWMVRLTVGKALNARTRFGLSVVKRLVYVAQPRSSYINLLRSEKISTKCCRIYCG